MSTLAPVADPRPATAEAASPAHAARVAALLRRMTLEEKVGQMTQLAVPAVAAAEGHSPAGVRLDPARLRHAIVDRHVGSILNVYDQALTPAAWHDLVGEIQRVATTETRLGIPVIYGIDAVHGMNYTLGGTIFPHAIGMAATFDRDLARATGEVTAREVHASAIPWNFAPVLDAGRQPLWPRFYETYGEDALVARELGREAVIGMQAGGRVAATLKHYLGYGAPRTGRDRTPAELSRRLVREHHLPAFAAAIRAGAAAVMVNSGEIDGEPLHASRYWLTDVLRDELGFQGVVVTDWEDIHFLHTRHRVAPSIREAVRLAIEAGIDVSMTPFEFGFADHLVALVREGQVAEARIDESVRRVLFLKARLGLLESPMADRALASEIGTASARALAQEAADASITLLANRGAMLPLAREARVLVAGPAARSASALHGGWSYTWQGNDPSRYPATVRTLLDAIGARAAAVQHVAGSGFTAAAPAGSDVAAAVAAAREVDAIVLALGEEGYAEWVGDVDDLTLPEPQLALARALLATGKPVVLVLLEGRPRLLAEIADGAHAVVMGYWPGAAGAEAIARVLYGEVSPSGRLPFTYPRRPNALDTYDHKYPEALGLGLQRAEDGFRPLFEFGHGLSYAPVAYADLTLDRHRLTRGGTVTVSLTVRNEGAYPVRESVLLFTRQHYARITPAVRRLRAFAKVALAPGESRIVRLVLGAEDLSYVGHDGRPVLEAGPFDVQVGGLVGRLEVEG
ncbi:MAG TPA: glycoside hydrolase family 3 N-terminal domain-containing protein [Gemmatimonadaceae bacterium]|nr:glycoside hydrolase family 3 N-terminal domain-containing protein [Gemmatimonadaceae bacterium]